MDGKAQIQNHQEKPSHHCSVSKRVKAKFKFEMFPLFFESLEKLSNPPELPLKFPQKIPPHHNGIKLYCEKLYECFLVFSDVVNFGQNASSKRLSMALKNCRVCLLAHESVKPTSLS